MSFYLYLNLFIHTFRSLHSVLFYWIAYRVKITVIISCQYLIFFISFWLYGFLFSQLFVKRWSYPNRMDRNNTLLLARKVIRLDTLMNSNFILICKLFLNVILLRWTIIWTNHILDHLFLIIRQKDFFIQLSLILSFPVNNIGYRIASSFT